MESKWQFDIFKELQHIKNLDILEKGLAEVKRVVVDGRQIIFSANLDLPRSDHYIHQLIEQNILSTVYQSMSERSFIKSLTSIGLEGFNTSCKTGLIQASMINK